MLVNGEPGNLISIRDRGLLYGDGVFRTLLASRGKAINWPQHYQKLQHDCAALEIPCPEYLLLTAELNQMLHVHPEGVLKIIITRGAAQRGYVPFADTAPSRIWDVFDVPSYPAEWSTSGIKAGVCQFRLSRQPCLAGIKHLNRLENVLASDELRKHDWDEGILLDTHDCVIEGTRTNLFMASGGALITPVLTECGVAGVQRDRVISLARQQDIALEVRDIGLNELMTADEIFLVNSIIGVWPVRELEQSRWSHFPLASRIREHLYENETVR